MKKIIILIIIGVVILTLYILYFSEKIQHKIDEQEVYPCECCIKYDSIKK